MTASASAATDAVHNAVLCVLEAAGRRQAIVTRTKLIKLLYLADLRAVHEVGKTFTGANWIWHHYGPFDAAIVDAEASLVRSNAVRREFTTNYFGNREVRLSLAEWTQAQVDAEFARIVGDIVQEYGHLAPSTITDVAYQTGPMIEAVEEGRRGVPLDLLSERPLPRVAAAVGRLRRRLRDLPAAKTEAEALREIREDIEAFGEARRRATSELLEGD